MRKFLMASSSALDKFDLALLKALQQDNTIPLRELASLVHLSTASVQRRIQRMQGDGVIKANTAVIDPMKVGKVITLLVEVHVERAQAQDLEVMKKQFSGSEIQQCYYVTGEADFVLVLTVADMEEFQFLAKRLFYNNANVKWFRTIVVMDKVKTRLDVPFPGIEQDAP
jgi:DNA-binding Lrp family transcriptional regulator